MSVRRFYLIGFGLLLAFDTLAQLSFKWAGLHGGEASLDLSWLLRVFAQPWIYGAIVGYVGAFFTWMSLLTRAPVGCWKRRTPQRPKRRHSWRSDSQERYPSMTGGSSTRSN